MRALLTAGIVAALVGTAVAGEDLDRARTLYREGADAFSLGDYRRALAAFVEAERLAVRPELEFNIGRCYEVLGDAANAVRHYRRYLDARPDTTDRSDVETAIKRLERCAR